MANEYIFQVDVDDDKGKPFGPVNKENLDIARFIYDFSEWLDESETVGQIDHVAIATAPPPPPQPPWQVDYPLDNTSATAPPPDVYPLTIVDVAIPCMEGLGVEIKVNAGTPGLTYVLSFAMTGTTSHRRRQVDTLVTIDWPLNPALVTPGDVTPTWTVPLIVGGSTALPLGFAGRVYIENDTTAPIQITLPPTPDIGQVVSTLDVFQNAAQYPVTFVGDGVDPINASSGDDFVSAISGDDLNFEWTGSFWALGSNKYLFLG
jgi:hypothetical protein